MNFEAARLAPVASVAKWKGRSWPKWSGKRVSTRVRTSSVTASGSWRMGRGMKRSGSAGLRFSCVEVPAAAGGVVAVHQEAGLAAHLAIEPFHPQFLAPLGPGGEFGAGGDEAVVGERLDGQGAGAERLPEPPFAAFGGDDALRVEFGMAAHEFAADRARRVGIVEAAVGDAPAVGFERGGEFAHGGEEEGDLLDVVSDVVRLVGDLGHDDDVAGFFACAQGGEGRRELVAQDEDQARAHHGIASPSQAKKPPVSAGVRPSMTASRLAAASSGETVGWRPAYLAVRSVRTVPG